MISQDKLNKLKHYMEGLNQEREIGEQLGDSIVRLIHKTDDPYVKAAIKASDIKIHKATPSGLFAQLRVIVNAAHILRGAQAFRALENASLTYDMLRSFEERTMAADFLWTFGLKDDGYKHYNPAFKKAKLKNLEGLMTAEHRAIFVKDCMKAASGYKLFKASQNVASRLVYFKPWKESKSSSSKMDHVVRESYTRLDGVKKDSDTKSANQVNAIMALYEMAKADQGYAISEASEKSIQVFLNALSYDLARIEDYAATHDDTELSNEIVQQIAAFRDTVWNEDNPESFVSFVRGMTAADVDKSKQIDMLQAFLSRGLKTVPDLVYGQNFRGVPLNDEKKRLKIQSYFEDKLAVLKEPNSSAEDIKEFDQKPSSLAALKTIHELSLTGQKVAIMSSFKPVNELLEKAQKLIQDVDIEVRHALLCALKRTGTYGETSLLGSFTAAIDAQRKLVEQIAKTPEAADKVNVAPLFSEQASALEQMNMIIESDLRMHGWNGQWPDNAKDQLPGKHAVEEVLAEPFYDRIFKYHAVTNYEESVALLEKDLSDRTDYIGTIKEYFNKAEKFVSEERRAEIASMVQRIDEAATDKLSAIETSDEERLNEYYAQYLASIGLG